MKLFRIYYATYKDDPAKTRMAFPAQYGAPDYVTACRRLLCDYYRKGYKVRFTHVDVKKS